MISPPAFSAALRGSPPLRRLSREAGFALAFLAVWMLAILAPAHQISRLGGEMRGAGVSGLSDWTLCLPGGAPEAPEEEGAAPLLCPAQSLAHALDAPPGITGVRLLLPRRLGLSLPSRARPASRRTRRGRKQPRAPPSRRAGPPRFPPCLQERRS